MSEVLEYGSEVELNWKASKTVVLTLTNDLTEKYATALRASGVYPIDVAGLVQDLGHRGRGLDHFPDFKIQMPSVGKTSGDYSVNMPAEHLFSQLLTAVEQYVRDDQSIDSLSRETLSKKMRGLRVLANTTQGETLKVGLRVLSSGQPAEITSIETVPQHKEG